MKIIVASLLVAVLCLSSTTSFAYHSKNVEPARQPTGAAADIGFTCPETLDYRPIGPEGWITPGHPATLSHAIFHIGWLGPVLAVALGALIALLVRGSRAAIELLARRHAARRALRADRGRWTATPPRFAPRLAVLAGNRAGRAPPRVSFS